MDNLLAAIMTKFTGSDFSTAVGGRIYLDEAPHGTAFPYAVFSIVAGTPEDTFREDIDDVLVQFSLYSTSPGAAEITGLYADLTALLDRQTLSITGATCVQMLRTGLVTMFDDITTPEGSSGVRHWAVDYAIMVHDT